jgi:LysR family D-serine deaminase transcriptional activator
LPAFIAVARNLSFTKAAEELYITQGAVSHQIRRLETHLGFPLFHRLTRKIALTDAGERLYRTIRGPLLNFENEIRTIQHLNVVGVLTVQSQPSIAHAWLVPRLHRFQALFPGVEIHMSCSTTNLDFKNRPVDIAIAYGEAPYRDVYTVPLMRETIVPVCSPAYADAHGLYAGKTESLAGCTLLHDNSPWPNAQFFGEWQAWADAVGFSGMDIRSGFSFDHSSLAFIAAEQGLGVAMGRKFLIQGALADGRLVAPIPLEVPGREYLAACRPENAPSDRIQKFLHWVREEAGMAEFRPVHDRIPPGTGREEA